MLACSFGLPLSLSLWVNEGTTFGVDISRAPISNLSVIVEEASFLEVAIYFEIALYRLISRMFIKNKMRIKAKTTLDHEFLIRLPPTFVQLLTSERQKAFYLFSVCPETMGNFDVPAISILMN
jgi:ribose 1,5-bisphosphokinase PhnN